MEFSRFQIKSYSYVIYSNSITIVTVNYDIIWWFISGNIIFLIFVHIFTSLLIKEIGYIGYNLVCFHGEDTSGKPLELIQHVQQLNFLLMVVPKPEIEAPNRQIGFVGQVEE